MIDVKMDSEQPRPRTTFTYKSAAIEEFRAFANDTTLHGVSHVLAPKSSLLRRSVVCII